MGEARMNIYEKLHVIQTTLKANKGQYNAFGKYKYRSCEDILEAIKPLLVQTSTILVVTDELVMIGDRYYVKANARLQDTEADVYVDSTGFAREEENKKGMDSSQVTGAASSYARKYALNGLLCIDDNKDADATNTHGKEEKKQLKATDTNVENKAPAKKPYKLPNNYITNVQMTAKECNYTPDRAKEVIKERYGKTSSTLLLVDEAKDFVKYMKDNKEAK